MAYSRQIIERAENRLAEEKSQHDFQQRSRREEIFAKYPRLAEIDVQLRSTYAHILKATFTGGGDTEKAMEQIRRQNRSLQDERAWILESNELDASDIEPEPLCTLCGGSGYRGAVMCSCLQELCRQEQKKELIAKLGAGVCFDGFRLDYYPDAGRENLSHNARDAMNHVKSAALRYARSFSKDSGSILMTGKPGLGKSFLAGCIARTVAENGFSVVFENAGVIFSDFETAKFSLRGEESEKLLAPYFTCDLLVIDDLGTEMNTQFNAAALYKLLQTRQQEGRAMIVSTNLTTEALTARYGASVQSRLAGSFMQYVFIGDDIRLLLNRNPRMGEFR